MVARSYHIMSEESVECRTPPHGVTVDAMSMPVVNNNNTETPSMCYGCGRKIYDRYYLLAVDKQWHAGCLKCADCDVTLDSELTCYAKDGNIYCKEDYYRRFAIKRCARCLHGIAANELVMRARDAVYHLHCFTCASCNSALTTGDQFGMHSDNIYCRNHYELLLRGDRGEFLAGTQLLDQGYSPTTPDIPFFNGIVGPQKGRPRKRKSPVLSVDPDCHVGLGLDDPDALDQYSQGGVPRQKRMRTSFKHHQLRTMKSYFALNHNPDAKDLKQLAQKTGLTKRVLQVWFQNARAKYRRNLLRQDGGSVQGSSEKAMSDAGQSDLSNARSPGGLSDVSTSPSLSDMHNHTLDDDEDSSSNISEIFTNSINAMS